MSRTRSVCYCSTVVYDQVQERATRDCRSLAKQMVFLVKKGLEIGHPLRVRGEQALLGSALDGDRHSIYFYPEPELVDRITQFRDRWDLPSDSAAIRVLIYTALFADGVKKEGRGE